MHNKFKTVLMRSGAVPSDSIVLEWMYEDEASLAAQYEEQGYPDDLGKRLLEMRKLIRDVEMRVAHQFTEGRNDMILNELHDGILQDNTVNRNA